MKLAEIVLAGCLAAAVPWPASAQVETTERQVKGAAGRDIRLGIYVNVRADCSSGPLPTIRLGSPPANGSVTVKKGNVPLMNRKNCLATEVPGFVAIYRSKANFSGADEVTLEINMESGKVVRQKFKITVEDTKARDI